MQRICYRVCVSTLQAAEALITPSPIEAVFQKHARHALLSYNEYFGELEERHHRQQHELLLERQSRIADLQARLSVERACQVQSLVAAAAVSAGAAGDAGTCVLLLT